MRGNVCDKGSDAVDDAPAYPGNLVFQAMKGMASGLGFEAEDPKMLFGRSAVFSFLLLASPQLCEIVLDMTARVITLLELPNAINVHLVDASILGNLFAGWLVVIVCNFIIMWKVLKLLLKIAEQYVVLSTLTIAAPSRQHPRKASAARRSGHGRIQADAGDRIVHSLCYLYYAENQHHPGDHIQSAGYGRHN